MLDKKTISQNMLAVLNELQANKAADIRIYNMLCNKLTVYCEVLSDDLPEEYISQIEEFVEL